MFGLAVISLLSFSSLVTNMLFIANFDGVFVMWTLVSSDHFNSLLL